MSPAPRDRGLLVGVMGLEDDARVDFPRLRRERRAKVLAGMERHGLDALMLGGVGNVRYVSGARQLGRAGVLPFAPVVVVVRETGRVHLLSTWDEGVPPEIGRDDLYGLSWNPVNLATSLASIDGLRQAQRVGCTPDTRLAWPALGWPEALCCKGRRIWRRDAPAVWTRWWRRAVQATPAQISTARGRATGTPNHRSRWRMGSDLVPSHR